MEKRNSSTSCLTPSNSMLVPLQTPPSHFHHRHSPAGGGDCSIDRRLAVATSPSYAAVTPFTTAGSRFRLPAGWGIEEVPRSSSSHVDRYYFEPGTGKKFRSLREVERHLNGEEYTPRSRELIAINHHKSPVSRKMIVSGGKLLSLDEGDLNMNHWAIVTSTNTATSRDQLPDGWVVEEVPRRDGSLVDKYYYEPGTGRKFRSRLGVERHLAEFGEHMSLAEALEVLNENRPLSKMFKLHQHTENCGSSKRNISGEVKQASSFVCPPSKIKWVLASSRGNAWNPFIAETSVPDSVKQQWNKRFTLFMNDEAAA